MTGIANRAEQIAAHLVGYETGAQVTSFDTLGRQAAVDFLLEWPDGRVGALEVTLVTEPESSAWQGMAMREGWHWPATTSWDFRPSGVSFPYRRTRRVVLRTVEVCDDWSVDNPADLPSGVLETEPDIAAFLADDVGSLRRSRFGTGVTLYPSTRAEFVDATPPEFSRVVESWLKQPHLDPHIDKLMRVQDGWQTHLFLVPTDDVLPPHFFTDDFEVPDSRPKGFGALDAVWIWSNYWHRYLVYRDRVWSWVAFPPEERGRVLNH